MKLALDLTRHPYMKALIFRYSLCPNLMSSRFTLLSNFHRYGLTEDSLAELMRVVFEGNLGGGLLLGILFVGLRLQV